MKRYAAVLTACLLLLLALLPSSASAADVIASGYCYNSTDLTWSLTDDGTLTISGEGEMPTARSYQYPWVSYVDSITKLVVSPGVTSIGDTAFSGHTALTEVNLADSVTAIGSNTFAGTSSLTAITLPAGLKSIGEKAFSGSGLTSVDLPDGLTSIGKEAFLRCESLLSATLPGSLETIGTYIFHRCTALTSVTVKEGITVVPEYTFYKCTALTDVSLPEGVTTIDDAAFANCEYLRSIDLPSTLTSIERNGFANCYRLKAMEFPAGLTSIAPYAFSRCLTLASADLPEGLITIGENAFTSCDITSVTIPASVENLGNGAFNNCYKLKTVVLPDDMTVIPERLFNQCGISSINFPSGLTTIGAAAFAGNAWDTEVVLPNSVTTIGAEAFRSCHFVTNFVLPEGLTTIGDNAFGYCYTMPQITIPSTVTSVGKKAFQGCTDLRDVIVEGKDTVFGEDIFPECSEYLTIYGPAGSKIQEYAATADHKFTSFGTGDHKFHGVTEDGLNWKLLLDGTLVISGSGAMGDYENTFQHPWEFKKNEITGVVVEDQVTGLDDMLFNGYPNLKSFHLGAALQKMGQLNFLDCPLFERVTASPDSKNYMVKDGVLYSADGKTLHLHPTNLGSTTFTIPAGVTAIDEGAFYGCTSLTHVDLPEGLETIGRLAFRGCDNIDLMELPDSLTSVGSDALSSFPVKTKLIPMEQAHTSKNQGGHLYSSSMRWADNIRSHLSVNEDGSFTLVSQDTRAYSEGQGLYSENQVFVEHYTRNGGQIQWDSGFQVDLSLELPLYGGYYTDGEYHYLVLGLNNPSELLDKEVIRIIKYSKDWSLRLGSADLYGASNVKFPFSAGTLRMDKYGDILYINTSREMLKDMFGINHQCGMTILFDTVTMRVLGWQGIVSHSFNQFIGAKNDRVYALHHGDAGPRSIILKEYPCKPGSPTLKGDSDSETNATKDVEILSIAGKNGDNITGVMVGALDYTGTVYLTAGASVIQDKQYAGRLAYNIFLAASTPGTIGEESNRIQWLTDYQEGDAVFAGNPYLTQVDKDKYLLFWPQCSGTNHANVRETGTISYVYVDATGNLLGEIKEFKGYLSDCEPIAVDGGAMWYTTNDTAPVFYYLRDDVLLTSDSSTGVSTIQVQGEADLVAAAYSPEGRLLDSDLLPLTPGAATVLSHFRSGATRYFLLEKETMAPLTRPFG